MATFKLEIKTPEKLIFSGEVESLMVEHPSGKEGYLAHHEPVLRELAPGKVIYRQHSGTQKEEEITGGFLVFFENAATLFVR